LRAEREEFEEFEEFKEFKEFKELQEFKELEPGTRLVERLAQFGFLLAIYAHSPS
jgi:hypothetical protein